MSSSNAFNFETPSGSAAGCNYNQRARAAEYIKRGWSPIPVKFMGEEPTPPDWQKLRIGVNDIDHWFPADQPQNIGVILGDPSNDLVVVDIVDRDALPFAESYLPRTWVFGRASRRRSHWIYNAPAEYIRDAVKPRKFVVGGCTIVDVRSDGQHAVFPGSIHESGEPITFGDHFDGSPRAIELFELELGIDMVLIATVLYKRWLFGGRRSLALNTAKCLLSAGWTQGGVERLINLVATQAGDDDVDGLAAIQSAFDLPATYKSGRSGLVDCMGEESVLNLEARWRNIEEWRDALDRPKHDFAPCEGFPRFRQFPPLASRRCNGGGPSK